MKLKDAIKGLDERTASLLLTNTLLGDLRMQADTIVENQRRGEKFAEDFRDEIISMLELVLRSPMPGSHKMPEDAPRYGRIAGETILASLWFPDMTEREGLIEAAYKDTLEWVFCDPQVEDKPWDNLTEFLQSKTPAPYWISGRPGCGKSTLMKFIAHNPLTKASLEKWSGGSPLFLARHYFSYKGSDTQRSEAGMLRSLLYQTLRQRLEIVADAFFGRYKTLFGKTGNGALTFEPRLHELREGLTQLVNKHSSVHFFLVIDGLDELDGTDADMSLLASSLKELGKRPNVKVLAASRPWTIFEESFKGGPSLQVHDLTRRDVLHFIDGQISNNVHIRALQSRYPPAVQALLAEIAEASSGVFLWVSLVVRSLLEGLRNYDKAEDLQRRLREFPPELHDLFHLMWRRVPQIYKAQSSRLLQLAEAGTSGGKVISLLGLSFAEEDDECVETAEVSSLKQADIDYRIDTARKHLATRCLGLVEVAQYHGDLGEPSLAWRLTEIYENCGEKVHGYPRARFLHKTVYEFLSTSHIRQEPVHVAHLGQGTGSASFPPLQSLARSSLMRIKTFRCSNADLVLRSLASLVFRCLAIAQEADKTFGLAQIKILMQLDRSLGLLSKTPSLSWLSSCPSLARRFRLLSDELRVERNVKAIPRLPPVDGLVAFAIGEGFFLSAKELLSSNPMLGLEATEWPLLLDALIPAYTSSTVYHQSNSYMRHRGASPDMVEFLLQKFPNASETVTDMHGKTWWIWKMYVEYESPARDDSEERHSVFLRIMVLFLRHARNSAHVSSDDLKELGELCEDVLKRTIVKPGGTSTSTTVLFRAAADNRVDTSPWLRAQGKARTFADTGRPRAEE
ncbi:hypothetical protein B0H67DRAFT_239897 [Lasiosphaeris hirsuta]|uniref:NACHT domain-containing protein n=1 Tax=Lasiosphaeris hirsuta TaxID=260670 RepID=A0AA40AGI1_9PEZI|nr:hypothetical protein B0H67DRAFT_239897 [Lasiosphaeris hirsuta]